MTRVVARERAGAPTARLSRVRCGHCAMPVRGSQLRCWSCGLDPRSPIGPEPQAGSVGVAETRSGASRRGWLLAASALLVLVVVAASVATLAPADGGQGMRGIAARVRGADWERAEVGGASAEFPGVPVRHATVPGPGLPRAGERLVSARAGLRTELLAAEVADRGTLLDGSAVAQGLVDGYAATSGGRVLRRTPLYLDGAPGVDAVVDADDGTIRVRATVAGTTAYLLAVVGPPEAFQRFTGSFRLEP